MAVDALNFVRSEFTAVWGRLQTVRFSLRKRVSRRSANDPILGIHQ